MTDVTDVTDVTDITYLSHALWRCRKLPVLLTVLLILAAAPMALRATFLDIGNQRYIVTTVTIEDGLPQNSVLCLRQTRDGYLWLGTRSGLVRFDGMAIRVFNRWNTPSLKNDRILALYEDGSGALWVGTGGGGVCRLKDGNWTNYSRRDGLSNNTVRAIAGGPGNVTWIGTDNGLNRLEDGNIRVFSSEDSLLGCQITCLMNDAAGALWIGTAGCGVVIMEKGKFRKLPMGEDFVFKEIKRFYRARSGVTWIGTDGGLYRLEKDAGKPESHGPKTPGEKPPPPAHSLLLPELSISQIIEDRDGSTWVGTDGEGIIKIIGKPSGLENGMLSITTLIGLPDDFVYSLLEDREKNLWIGTYTSGLVQLKKTDVRTISTAEGLPENTVHTAVGDHRGRLWIGTERKGLAVFKDGAVLATVTAKDGLTGNRVRALYLDKDNFLWIGTNRGLNRMPLNLNIKEGIGKIKRFTVSKGLVSDKITAIFQDRAGTVWVGTAAGLSRIMDNAVVGGKVEGLENLVIRTLGEDTEGRVLAGTRSGLFRAEQAGHRFSLFPGESETPGDTENGEKEIKYDVPAFLLDKKGDLWVGTNGSGLIRYYKDRDVNGDVKNKGKNAGGEFKRESITTEQGIPGNNIFSITEDDDGFLWMSTYNGVFRLDPKHRTIAIFDESRGMISRECVMTGHPSAWKELDGEIYIPTVKGLAVFNPAEHAAESPGDPGDPGDPGSTGSVRPAVIIEQVIADNRDITREVERTLPNGTQVLEFQFTALSFAAPEKVTIHYRLEGYDDRWQVVAPKQNRRALYLNLPPGDYRFIVIAGNNDGAWNREGARFEFSVAAPLYRRLIGGGFAVLLLALLATVLWLHRAGKAKKTGEKKETAAPAPTGEQKEKKYKTSALLPETVQQVLPQLDRLMKEEKIFLDPDLSLKALAEKLNVHYNHLSQIINEHLGKSFNDFINGHRIEEARRKLADPAQAQKNVLEIAYDTGFYSKSVFNTAFKKFTGMTPSQYRKMELKP